MYRNENISFLIFIYSLLIFGLKIKNNSSKNLLISDLEYIFSEKNYFKKNFLKTK